MFINAFNKTDVLIGLFLCPMVIQCKQYLGRGQSGSSFLISGKNDILKDYDNAHLEKNYLGFFDQLSAWYQESKTISKKPGQQQIQGQGQVQGHGQGQKPRPGPEEESLKVTSCCLYCD